MPYDWEDADLPVSTHTPRAGRDSLVEPIRILSLVSTHTPRAGRDLSVASPSSGIRFQPTRPVRGVTPNPPSEIPSYGKFQPTRPVRGVTSLSGSKITYHLFQPTRPVRGVTLLMILLLALILCFNPHAPCGA